MSQWPRRRFWTSAGEPAATDIGHGWFGEEPSGKDLNQRQIVGRVTYGSAGARG